MVHCEFQIRFRCRECPRSSIIARLMNEFKRPGSVIDNSKKVLLVERVEKCG
jgi:hypothetical protein